jgi:ribosomal protein L11 methyltransferase
VRTWPALEIHQADGDTGDLIQAFLTDFSATAIDDNNPGVSRVFFHDSAERDRAANALQTQFPTVGVRSIDMPDEDWAARSQAALRAIQVGTLVVAPPWDLPADVNVRAATIVIEPSMGFGTGHHATTRLCLSALQQIDLRGRSVIDVGTGSGVLAIAVRRLGAAAVLAIDDDPDAIAAAEANVALNGESRIALEVTDLRSSPIGQFDIVVANLTGGLLVASAARLTSFATPPGRLVLSGFMDHEEREVLGAFGTCAVETRAKEDEWICVVLRQTRTLSTS